MWTSTLNFDSKRLLLTQLIGRFYRDIYFTSWAPLQVQNLPRQPLPSSNWVRVRNRLAGICGSDLQLVYGDGDQRISLGALPTAHGLRYPGHELVGEVIEIGDRVQRLNVGDRVTLCNSANCLSMNLQPPCRSCAVGNYNLCEQAANPGLHAIGGGWSEELLVHEQQLFSLPATISDEQAVMIEPTAVALHAALRRLPQPEEHVLIIGAGTIGLLMLQIMRALVPQAQISIMARHPFQVEQATRLGASNILYPQDAYAGVQRATGSKLYHGQFGNQMLTGGYDVIYDTIGHKNTLHHALRWVRAQGSVVLVGVSLHLMHIDLTPIWYQEVNLIGSMSHGMEIWPIGTTQRRSTFSIVTELLQRGLLHPERLITHHFALDNYKHAVTTARDKKNSRAIKVVFDYSLLPASVVPTVRASSRQLHTASGATKHVIEVTPEGVEQKQAIPQLQTSTTPRNTVVRSTPTPSSELNEQDLLNAMSYPVSNDANEDTAAAIPVVSRRLRALPTPDNDVPTQRIQKRPSYASDMPSTPLDVAKNETTPASVENTDPAVDDAHQTIEVPTNAAPDTTGFKNLQSPTGLSLLEPDENIASMTSADLAIDKNAQPFSPEIQTLSPDIFPELSPVSTPVFVEDEVQPDNQALVMPETNQQPDDSVDLTSPDSDVTQEFTLPAEHTIPSQEAVISTSTTSAPDEDATPIEEEPDATSPTETGMPPDGEIPAIDEQVTTESAGMPDEETTAAIEPIVTAPEALPDEEVTVSAETPVQNIPWQTEGPSDAVDNFSSPAQQLESTANQEDAETSSADEDEASEIGIIDKDAEIETKEHATALPFVEETPTVLVQPRLRPRKKR